MVALTCPLAGRLDKLQQQLQEGTRPGQEPVDEEEPVTLATAISHGGGRAAEGFVDVTREFQPSAEPYSAGDGLAIAIGDLLYCSVCARDGIIGALLVMAAQRAVAPLMTIKLCRFSQAAAGQRDHFGRDGELLVRRLGIPSSRVSRGLCARE